MGTVSRSGKSWRCSRRTVTLPLSRMKLQPRLSGSSTKRAAVWVSGSKKPERGPLSRCSHGPPEGPQHPLIKYTSGGRTLLWEGDTGRQHAGSPAGEGRGRGGRKSSG
ncbi:hypothetical protein CgunFtcFv8_002562 [Champsocephalus gunnari]|uniref:Uncharacterized protein n=1 Tax=Champsocephalus gunnari TaxID=52237 RepID=A0AAN8DH48_CHAGU|nr:hypothetical protein CgunFtcFv8_002562 [Champsocephalus gunnari]